MHMTNLFEYLGVYCQMAMGHSFVRHLLCSRHPGTRFFLDWTKSLQDQHHLVSWAVEWRWRPLALHVKDTKRRGRTIFNLIFEFMSHNSRIRQGCLKSCVLLSCLAHFYCPRSVGTWMEIPGIKTVQLRYKSIFPFHKVDRPYFFRKVHVHVLFLTKAKLL